MATIIEPTTVRALSPPAPPRPVANPFTIIIDTREQTPWRFTGIKSDARTDYRPLIVPCERGTLASGDYSIQGYESLVAVERKSLADLYSTLGSGRDRFEAEHERLASMHSAAVVIEADWDTIMHHPPERSRLLPKTVFRTSIAWYQRYGVAWFAMPGARAAEAFTFHFLTRFWKDQQAKE